MSLPELKYCPGTLAEGFKTYSPECIRNLFYGKMVSHVLPFTSPHESEDVVELFMENIKHISISGVQQKLSLVQENKLLRLTNANEQGTHILKPIPSLLRKANQMPANEHLTMQIAKQVYCINTADNAMIFFKDGTPAYITKRFDVKPDGSRLGKEDFATLAGKSKHNSDENYKYNFSYEELGLLIQKYVPVWKVEIENYFSLVVFNFLFSNGDAHLKNFALIEDPHGDYIFSPAYDLINSRIHVDDSDFAFDKGLFTDDFKSENFKKSNHPCKEDFIELGKRIGLKENRTEKLIQPFLEKQPRVEILLSRSFLNDAGKRAYQFIYNTKRNFLIA
ncbi:MAG: HipA domain-containing protein [Chitinophagaceae bacterium]|nr:HipA domain-containing protein [Chitinophagaceae bacterium]